MMSPKRSIGGGGIGNWGFVRRMGLGVTGFCRVAADRGLPWVGRVITGGLMNGESSAGGVGGEPWGEVFGLIGELASDIAATNLLRSCQVGG